MDKKNTETESKNPIEYYYKGIAVRKYPLIQIRVSQIQFKQFVDAKIDFGLSPEQAIAQKKALCNICNEIEIKKYNINDKSY